MELKPGFSFENPKKPNWTGDAGEVYKIIIDDNELAVLKKPNAKTQGRIQSQAGQIFREARVLEKLGGKSFGKSSGYSLHVPKLIDEADAQFRNTAHYFFISGYAQGNDLSHYLGKSAEHEKKLFLLFIMKATLDMFKTIHNQGYLWNDLKPDHIFIDTKNNLITFIDWGNVVAINSQGESEDKNFSKFIDYQHFAKEFKIFLDNTLVDRLDWNNNTSKSEIINELKNLYKSIENAIFIEEQKIEHLYNSAAQIMRNSDPKDFLELGKIKRKLNQLGFDLGSSKVKEFLIRSIFKSYDNSDYSNLKHNVIPLLIDKYLIYFDDETELYVWKALIDFEVFLKISGRENLTKDGIVSSLKIGNYSNFIYYIHSSLNENGNLDDLIFSSEEYKNLLRIIKNIFPALIPQKELYGQLTTYWEKQDFKAADNLAKKALLVSEDKRKKDYIQTVKDIEKAVMFIKHMQVKKTPDIKLANIMLIEIESLMSSVKSTLGTPSWLNQIHFILEAIQKKVSFTISESQRDLVPWADKWDQSDYKYSESQENVIGKFNIALISNQLKEAKNHLKSLPKKIAADKYLIIYMYEELLDFHETRLNTEVLKNSKFKKAFTEANKFLRFKSKFLDVSKLIKRRGRNNKHYVAYEEYERLVTRWKNYAIKLQKKFPEWKLFEYYESEIENAYSGNIKSFLSFARRDKQNFEGEFGKFNKNWISWKIKFGRYFSDSNIALDRNSVGELNKDLLKIVDSLEHWINSPRSNLEKSLYEPIISNLKRNKEKFFDIFYAKFNSINDQFIAANKSSDPSNIIKVIYSNIEELLGKLHMPTEILDKWKIDYDQFEAGELELELIPPNNPFAIIKIQSLKNNLVDPDNYIDYINNRNSQKKKKGLIKKYFWGIFGSLIIIAGLVFSANFVSVKINNFKKSIDPPFLEYEISGDLNNLIVRLDVKNLSEEEEFVWFLNSEEIAITNTPYYSDILTCGRPSVFYSVKVNDVEQGNVNFLLPKCELPSVKNIIHEVDDSSSHKIVIRWDLDEFIFGETEIVIIRTDENGDHHEFSKSGTETRFVDDNGIEVDKIYKYKIIVRQGDFVSKEIKEISIKSSPSLEENCEEIEIWKNPSSGLWESLLNKLFSWTSEQYNKQIVPCNFQESRESEISKTIEDFLEQTQGFDQGERVQLQDMANYKFGKYLLATSNMCNWNMELPMSLNDKSLVVSYIDWHSAKDPTGNYIKHFCGDRITYTNIKNTFIFPQNSIAELTEIRDTDIDFCSEDESCAFTIDTDDHIHFNPGKQNLPSGFFPFSQRIENFTSIRFILSNAVKHVPGNFNLNYGKIILLDFKVFENKVVYYPKTFAIEENHENYPNAFVHCVIIQKSVICAKNIGEAFDIPATIIEKLPDKGDIGLFYRKNENSQIWDSHWGISDITLTFIMDIPEGED
jgi:hypothetical protein